MTERPAPRLTFERMSAAAQEAITVVVECVENLDGYCTDDHATMRRMEAYARAFGALNIACNQVMAKAAAERQAAERLAALGKSLIQP